jgi:large subunit ribosomal protein L31
MNKFAILMAMKADIHPKYYDKAAVKCACGNTFTVGSTKPEIKIEICHKCHPFYTGEEKLIDTAGRVEKFKARRAKAIAAPKRKKLRHTQAVGVPTEASGKVRAKKAK